jgi:uncharacterized protein (DUF2062 family)
LVRNFSVWQRLQRLARHRLVVPIQRSPHPPEHTARAVMVGLFWAMTPLIGVQMYLVFFTWLIARRSPKMEFGLIISLAWTWVTNVFTMWPIYYAFYITGRVLLGQPDEMPGYDSFIQHWQGALSNGDGFFETLLAQVKLIAHDKGLPLAIGCLPYAFLSAWLGYVFSLKYVIRRRAAKARASRRATPSRMR